MKNFALLTLLAYLLGSIPSGLLVARFMKGPDPRTQGSGNLGAANLYRLLGLKAAVITFLGDAGKGALPVILALNWLALGAWREAGVAAVGTAAVLGHIFPLYLGFRGGKGVATAFGVVAALVPLAAANLVLVYIMALVQTRIFSAASLIAAWFLPLAVGLFSPSKAYLFLAGVLSGLILVCHRENLERIFKGEEPRI
ncbi:MAG: glycerol-3-phosphate 1-O-acyltransferase PlsY [Deltaproteobacteria bacterium]|nr:glycerol-3-phosphate 1-O-acyltransferase PlsY [Deltaproteobacteria bacterium]